MKAKRFTRSFTLLILGQSSSLLGNFTLKFALSMYVLEKTGSAAVLPDFWPPPCCPPYCFPPFGGILAEPQSRGNTMVALDVLSGLAVLTAGNRSELLARYHSHQHFCWSFYRC